MRSGDRSAVLDLRPIKNNAWTCSPFVRWILAQKPHPPFTCESLLTNCLPRESRERTRVVKWRTVGRKKHQLQPLALHDMLPRFLEVMTLSLHAFLPDRHLQQIASNTCAQLVSKRSNWQATRAILSPALLQTAWYCIRALWHREERRSETAVDQRRQLLLVLYPLQAFPA